MQKRIILISFMISFDAVCATSIVPSPPVLPLFDTEFIHIDEFLQDCSKGVRYADYSLACKGLLAGPIKTTDKILTLFLPTNTSLEQTLKAKHLTVEEFLLHSNSFAKGHIAVDKPTKVDLPQSDYYEIFDYRSMTFALRNIKITYSKPPREAITALKTYERNGAKYTDGNLEYDCGYGSVQVGGTKANILPAPLNPKPINTTLSCIYPIDRPLPF